MHFSLHTQFHLRHRTWEIENDRSSIYVFQATIRGTDRWHLCLEFRRNIRLSASVSRSVVTCKSLQGEIWRRTRCEVLGDRVSGFCRLSTGYRPKHVKTSLDFGEHHHVHVLTISNNCPEKVVGYFFLR